MITSGGNASSIPLMGGDTEPTIFELSKPRRRAFSLGDTGVDSYSVSKIIPKDMLRTEKLDLVEMSERDVVAHFTRLSHRQFSVDLGAYPLGSCTMKYNPKICDEASEISHFTDCHPSLPANLIQGWLEIFYSLEKYLAEITGMDAVSLQPAAGAQGELTGLLITKAYHVGRNDTQRNKIIIPQSAHGTNPASVTLAGFEPVIVRSRSDGLIDLEHLKSLLDIRVAGIMLTNPNTLGIFEREILDVSRLVHQAGALLYYDGANLNPIVGKTKPGLMGFDIVHLNLHKTFATPHGGGGPGAGPIAVSERLKDYLPGPVVRKDDTGFFDWFYPEKSIGRIHSWHGNALVLLRAYAYIRLNGRDGLKIVAELATLNANYLAHLLKPYLDLASPLPVKHEAVFSMAKLKRKNGIKAIDIAKALLDRGFHAPTMYFPLVVEEALMIEPTETESPETVEAFVETLIDILELAEKSNDEIISAPRHTPVSRVDEALAARKLRSTYDSAP